MGNFARDITKFCEKTKLKPGLVLRKLALQALIGVIRKSPVLSGRFRGNWRVAIGGADLTSFIGRNSQRADKTGDKTIAEGAGTIQKAPLDGDVAIYITNNLPYAQRIEDGWSKQKAPQGVLKVTFNEIILDFEKTVKSVEDAEPANG